MENQNIPLIEKNPVKWYKSKGVWTGIVTIGLGSIPFVDSSFHTHITSTPGYNLAILIAGGFGIHFRMGTNRLIEKKIL